MPGRCGPAGASRTQIGPAEPFSVQSAHLGAPSAAVPPSSAPGNRHCTQNAGVRRPTEASWEHLAISKYMKYTHSHEASCRPRGSPQVPRPVRRDESGSAVRRWCQRSCPPPSPVHRGVATRWYEARTLGDGRRHSRARVVGPLPRGGAGGTLVPSLGGLALADAGSTSSPPRNNRAQTPLWPLPRRSRGRGPPAS